MVAARNSLFYLVTSAASGRSHSGPGTLEVGLPQEARALLETARDVDAPSEADRVRIAALLRATFGFVDW